MELMPDIQLDRSSGPPLFQQIAVSIRELIRAGRLPAGTKLPATRSLAKQLGIHRRTVVSAFALLQSEGWLQSGVGQGTFVRARAESAARARPSEPVVPGAFTWETRLRRRPATAPEPWRYFPRAGAEADPIRLMGATADPALFPADDFRGCLDDVFRELGSDALEYGPPEGFAPLREWVSETLRARGVAVDPEGVLVISGSQQGLDLISRLLVREGDTVLVEEPGYSNGFRLFQANGARAVGVPIDEGGLRLEALSAETATTEARLLYTMPVYQNPTGVCLAEARHAALLDLCAARGLPIVEDQFDADLCYDGPMPAPLKAIDARDQVVLLGSFSKILFPGLRLGWMAAPRALAGPLRELKEMSDFSSGLLVQCAMNLFCRRGLLARHLDRVRAIYGARLSAMLEALERELPAGTTWTRPRGGLTLWVTLPPGGDAWELLQSARREGVEFSPGALFYPNGGGSGHLRLSWVRESEDRIRRGIACLGSLLKEHHTRARSAASSGPFF